MDDVRTWIEIDADALSHNTGEFLKIIPRRTRLMAVIKSNAYGHDFILVAKALRAYRKFGVSSWFGVDSITEGLRLRREGIKNPILVLGGTLPSRFSEAREKAITISISNFHALRALAHNRARPDFHVKIDTGMHRQGFLSHEIPALLRDLKRFRANPAGIYTHFAAAKDPVYPTYTNMQFAAFTDAVKRFSRAGFKNMVRHVSASGGTILFPETHLDMVRIGIGLYGYWPSPETKMHYGKKISLTPVLAWKALVGEVKEIPTGSFVGYDSTERVLKNTRIAVIPIGYWHGYDRGLSSVGEVLIRGIRARVLGRVSMDMIVVDVASVRGVRVGDEAVLIGTQKKNSVFADEIASKIGTSPYEVLTRLNPLMRRIAV